MKVGVTVMRSVPNTVLKGIGRYLKCRLWKIVLALVIVQLNGAEADVVA